MCVYVTRILQRVCDKLSFIGKLRPVSVETLATYRVIQGERSVFWEVIVSAVVRKQGHINVYLILMVTELELFEAPDQIPLDFCLWGWVKSEGYNRDVDTRDEICDCILGAAVRRRRTRDFRTRVATCTTKYTYAKGNFSSCY